MQELLNQLSKELIYDSHTISENICTIYCHIAIDESKSLHSHYTRKFKDINFGSYNVIIIVDCPKYYINLKENRKTMQYPFSFLTKSSRMSKRLSSFIEENLKESSAIGLERTLKSTIVNISDTTILRILKKKNS